MTAIPRRRAGLVSLPRVDVRMVLGLALVAVALAGGLTYAQSMRQTSPVLVAAQPIPPGHVIGRDDVQVTQARLEGPLATMAIGERDIAAVIGQTASGAIHAGALITRPDLGTGPVIGPDEVAVTVPVEANSVYGGLRRSDVVAVIATSEQGKPQSRTETVLERATVYDVGLDATRVKLNSNGGGEDGRVANVTLVVPRLQAERLTHALINGKLTLLLAPQSGVRQ